MRAALPEETGGNGSTRGTADPATVKEPLARLKQLLEADDGEAADFIVDAKPQLAGVLTSTEIKTLTDRVGKFDFDAALKCLSGIASRSVPQPREQMMSAPDKKLVLIVDDTPTNVAVVSGVLKDSFRTKVATNGEKALAIATGAEKPDLILLDVMMPGMDGYEVCRRLKDNPATRDIPIIFLTAKTEEVDEEKGFDVGAVDYIHKPFSGPIVLARVRTQLALQEALIEAQESRKQADQLLHALLPKKAADEIRAIGTVIPRRYENVAVLFCDVTNFTAYCDKHEPEDVVSRLDALFVIFERITAKHGLEKIKTIGDGFMAAAGLLHKVNDPIGAAGSLRPRDDLDPDRRPSRLGGEGRRSCRPGGRRRGRSGALSVRHLGRHRQRGRPHGRHERAGKRRRHQGDLRPDRQRFRRRSAGELDVKGKGAISVFGLRLRRA